MYKDAIKDFNTHAHVHTYLTLITPHKMLKNTGLFAEYRSLFYISFAKETHTCTHI